MPNGLPTAGVGGLRSLASQQQKPRRSGRDLLRDIFTALAASTPRAIEAARLGAEFGPEFGAGAGLLSGFVVPGELRQKQDVLAQQQSQRQALEQLFPLKVQKLQADIEAQRALAKRRGEPSVPALESQSQTRLREAQAEFFKKRTEELGKPKARPLSSQTKKDVAKIDVMESDLNRIEQILTKERRFPRIAVAQARLGGGVFDPELRAAFDRFTAQYANLISGVAVSEAEFKRLSGLLPSVRDLNNPQVFKIKIDSLRSNIKTLRKRMLETGGEQSNDVDDLISELESQGGK